MSRAQLSKNHRIEKVDLVGNYVLKETQDGENKYKTISEPGTYTECFEEYKEISDN